MPKKRNKTNNIPRKQNDELLKGAFEEWFVEFLRFLYPNADDLFDLSRGLTMMDKELLSVVPDRERKKGKCVADLLVKVYLTDGMEKWILLHTEIEGGNDEDFAFRLFQYHYRLVDRYGVPVETIAVFTGERNQRRPSEYWHQGIRTSIQFRFLTYQVFDHSEAELLAMDNPFSLIVLACQKAHLEGKVPEEELGENRSTIARALIGADKYDKDRIISFLVFLKNFIFIDNEEINRKFDELIYEVSGGTIDMGVIEVIRKQERQQGAEQKSYEFVVNLLDADKFTIAEIANYATVSEAFVYKVRAELNKKKK